MKRPANCGKEARLRLLQKMPAGIEKVVVHPLVLLSVTDHHNRVAKESNRRVVGVLLGEHSKGQLDVTNCYAVPFEEDERDPSVWFLDHSYHESMFSMFKRINGTLPILRIPLFFLLPDLTTLQCGYHCDIKISGWMWCIVCQLMV